MANSAALAKKINAQLTTEISTNLAEIIQAR